MDGEVAKAEISSDSDIEIDDEVIARRQQDIPDTPSSDSSSDKEGSDWTICLPSDSEGKVKVKKEPSSSSNNVGQGQAPSMQSSSASPSPFVPRLRIIEMGSRAPTSTQRVFADTVKTKEMKSVSMKRKRPPLMDTSSSSESEDNSFRKGVAMSPFRPGPVGLHVLSLNETSQFTSRIRQRTGLYGDLAELWKSKDFSDIVFQCEGGELKAHKLIVSARSEVFHAMFSSGMSETTSNVVKIDDIKLDTMKILVEYMYTGCVEPLSIEELADLLRAADKYQMNKLKNACFELLIGKMKVNNAGELVMLAHLHNADERVKFKIQEYIIRMRGELWAVPEFKAMVAANPMVFCTMIYESYNQFDLINN